MAALSPYATLVLSAASNTKGRKADFCRVFHQRPLFWAPEIFGVFPEGKFFDFGLGYIFFDFKFRLQDTDYFTVSISCIGWGDFSDIANAFRFS